MSERKYTDEEIIKGLECLCGHPILCEDCAFNGWLYPVCKQSAAREALDLINRPKAEIESLGNSVRLQAEMLYEARAEAIEEFAERLKENRNRIFNTVYSDYHFGEIIDTLVKEMTEGK